MRESKSYHSRLIRDSRQGARHRAISGAFAVLAVSC
jgi:hypothetical protein